MSSSSSSSLSDRLFVFSNISWKNITILVLILYIILTSFYSPKTIDISSVKWASSSSSSTSFLYPVNDQVITATNHSHIVFGLLGSVKTWPHRRGYIEAWWRPKTTRGYLFLDTKPTKDLLPWPKTSPPYRIVDDLSKLFENTKPLYPLMPRMVHAIMELFREEHDDVRWVVMGDDDSIFFIDNIVDTLSQLDHRKYYYLGWHSETVISNFWYSFKQAFGGGGIVLSYPLARALSKDMDSCLIRYAKSISADLITMTCIADIGVDLTPHKGIHQVDLHGDFSGFLSSHPKVPLMSFHHFDAMDPIFPSKDRVESTRHLMKAAEADHSRLLQQIICYHRKKNWSFSISWGYSVNIYERIMPRSYLQTPIETFTPWAPVKETPFYMFNTRQKSQDPCEAPHVFFFDSVKKGDKLITKYIRSSVRGLGTCNQSAENVSVIEVISPPTKRLQMDRCECCDVDELDESKARISLRECKLDEIIA